MAQDKWGQREDETIDKFLDDLEMLRRRSQPDGSNCRMKLAVASKFNDGGKNDELRTMLATHYTPLSTKAPTPEELRHKSKEYLLLKRHRDLVITKTIMAILTMDQLTNQQLVQTKGRHGQETLLCKLHFDRTTCISMPNLQTRHESNSFSLEDEEASEVNHEDFLRGVIAKFGPRCFFCTLEGHFKSDCAQFWDAVANIKHPRQEEALLGVKASKARLLSEAEARRKEKPQELARKKPQEQAVAEETREPEPVTAADDFKIDSRAAARDASNRFQQELVTKEIEQNGKLELEIEKTQERLNAFEASKVEETKVPSS